MNFDFEWIPQAIRATGPMSEREIAIWGDGKADKLIIPPPPVVGPVKRSPSRQKKLDRPYGGPTPPAKLAAWMTNPKLLPLKPPGKH